MSFGPVASHYRSLRRRWGRLIADRGGATAVVFAVAALPMIVGIGAAVDYGRGTKVRGEMQKAADAAALAGAKLGDAPPGKIRQEAKDVFAANFKETAAFTALQIKVEKRAGSVFVAARGKQRNLFMRLVGATQYDIQVEAEAGMAAGAYMDIHVFMDMSGSMNIPDGPTAMAALHNVFYPYGIPQTPGGGCSFACHVAAQPGLDHTYNGKTGFQTARDANIVLREDNLRTSLALMLQDLKSFNLNGQIRAALYAMTNGATPILSPTTNLDTAIATVQGMANNSGGSELTLTASMWSQWVPSSGPGTITSPKQVVIFMTDGVDQDAAQNPVPVKPQECQKFKDKGIEVFVLNLVYPHPSTLSGNADKVAKVAAIYPQIRPALEACASPGRYFEATHGPTVGAAMKALGAQVTAGNKALSLIR